MTKEKTYVFYTLSASDDPNNIRYVGTTSLTVAQRFRGHKYCAMHKEKRGLPVHKWMFSKYERNLNIIHMQIDSCLESEWEERERYWIKYYKDQGFELLNIDKGGRGVITAEMRSKSSIERSIEAKRKPVIALNIDGTLYKEFPSIREAASECNINNMQSIFNVLHKMNKSAGGYIWVFKDEYDSTKNYSYKKEYSSKCVYKFDDKFKLVESFESKMAAIQSFGITSYTGLTNAIKYKKLYKGFYWAETSEFNNVPLKISYKYEVTDENGQNIKFKMRKELAEYLQVSGTFITTSLKKNNPWNYNGKIIRTI